MPDMRVDLTPHAYEADTLQTKLPCEFFLRRVSDILTQSSGVTDVPFPELWKYM